MEGHVDLVELLTRHTDWKGNKTLLNDTPLHIACKYERVKVVELLLEKKANVNAKNSVSLNIYIYIILSNFYLLCLNTKL